MKKQKLTLLDFQLYNFTCGLPSFPFWAEGQEQMKLWVDFVLCLKYSPQLLLRLDMKDAFSSFLYGILKNCYKLGTLLFIHFTETNQEAW